MISKELAKKACRLIETNKGLHYEDAVLVSLMEPDLDEHTIILEQAHWNGESWEAYLLYTDAHRHEFIKRCIKKDCRSKMLAEIMSQYAKSNHQINQFEQCDNCNCTLGLKYKINNN